MAITAKHQAVVLASTVAIAIDPGDFVLVLTSGSTNNSPNSGPFSVTDNGGNIYVFHTSNNVINFAGAYWSIARFAATQVTVTTQSNNVLLVVTYSTSVGVFGMGSNVVNCANGAGATIGNPLGTTQANSMIVSLYEWSSGTPPVSITAATGVLDIQRTYTTGGQAGAGAIHLQTTTVGSYTNTANAVGGNASSQCQWSFELIVLASAPAVDVSKLVSYMLPGVPTGVDISKLVAYAIIGGQNTNPPVWPNIHFPDGIVGVPYYTDWDLAPSAPPTTYTTVIGTIPPGTTLNNLGLDIGSIAGTPTLAGTYIFTLRATNLFGTADKQFTIVIHPPSFVPGFGSSTFTYAV